MITFPFFIQHKKINETAFGLGGIRRYKQHMRRTHLCSMMYFYMFAIYGNILYHCLYSYSFLTVAFPFRQVINKYHDEQHHASDDVRQIR